MMPLFAYIKIKYSTYIFYSINMFIMILDHENMGVDAIFETLLSLQNYKNVIEENTIFDNDPR